MRLNDWVLPPAQKPTPSTLHNSSSPSRGIISIFDQLPLGANSRNESEKSHPQSTDIRFAYKYMRTSLHPVVHTHRHRIHSTALPLNVDTLDKAKYLFHVTLAVRLIFGPKAAIAVPSEVCISMQSHAGVASVDLLFSFDSACAWRLNTMLFAASIDPFRYPTIPAASWLTSSWTIWSIYILQDITLYHKSCLACMSHNPSVLSCCFL